tara:strand:- start:58 stop:339 length:282 start_codon:yes stop_codon:yes gene_type:complete
MPTARPTKTRLPNAIPTISPVLIPPSVCGSGATVVGASVTVIVVVGVVDAVVVVVVVVAMVVGVVVVVVAIVPVLLHATKLFEHGLAEQLLIA